MRGDADVHERRDERELRGVSRGENTAGIAAEGGGVNSTASKSSVGEEERELVVVENPPVKLRDGRVVPNVSVAVEIHNINDTK